MTDPTDDDARAVVADLAARGGDAAAVSAYLVDLLDEHAEHRAELLTLTLTALAVTFAECLPYPVSAPRPPAEGTVPPATDERTQP